MGGGGGGGAVLFKAYAGIVLRNSLLDFGFKGSWLRLAAYRVLCSLSPAVYRMVALFALFRDFRC